MEERDARCVMRDVLQIKIGCQQEDYFRVLFE